jgi:hypothetical protein
MKHVTQKEKPKEGLWNRLKHMSNAEQQLRPHALGFLYSVKVRPARLKI